MTSKEQPKTECCMCGDFGFSDQLFKCKICHFRSQHRYCSNLYPKTESFTICNWCLSQKEDSPNSSNSSSSYKNNGSTEDEGKNKRIKNCIPKKGLIRGNSGGVGVLHLQLQKPLMQKPKSPSEAKSPLASTSPSVLVSTRKRIITNGALEEKLRRTRSENIINSGNRVGATKQVFRNKVRRYKLLDEVSS